MINQDPKNIDTTITQSRRGMALIKRMRELRVGAGETMFGADIRGIWLGASKPEDAPFYVDMQGNLVGLTLSGATIDGATITGGLIRTSENLDRIEMTSDFLTLYSDDGLGGSNPTVELGGGGIAFGSASGLPAGFIGGTPDGISINAKGELWTISDLSFSPESNQNIGNTMTAANEVNTIYLTNAPVVSSDIRFKENIKDLKYGLKDIEKINPISFTRPKDKRKYLGFSAQEVQKILPEIIEGDKRLSMRPEEIIPVLVNAVKELSDEVKQLKANMV
jgi:hypothetical protein